MVSYSLERWLLFDLPLKSEDAMSALPIVVFGVAAMSEDRRTQIATALISLGLLVAFTLRWTESLSQLLGTG